MLKIQKINKFFGEKQVVCDFDLEMEQGEIVCLLGESGCGKTTTLQMIGGFLSPDSGKIELNGLDITRQLAEEREIATVFQSYALFPHMNVFENVSYGLRFRKLSTADRLERGKKALELVGLLEFSHARIQDLSGGQQQRVAFARAVCIEPKLLLLDEPFSNLDANLRRRLRKDLKQLQRRLGINMIFVTHDQDEAMALGDRIALMREGRIVQIGTPQEIYRHPKDLWVKEFFGQVNQLYWQDKVHYLYPEELCFVDEEGMWQGRVVEKEFHGASWEYLVDTEAGEIVIGEEADVEIGSFVCINQKLGREENENIECHSTEAK